MEAFLSVGIAATNSATGVVILGKMITVTHTKTSCFEHQIDEE